MAYLFSFNNQLSSAKTKSGKNGLLIRNVPL